MKYRRHLIVVFVAALFGVAVSFGCEGLFDDPEEIAEQYPADETTTCETTDDCEDDEVCEAGVCIGISCAGVDCESDESCYQGQCFETCEEPTQCEEGQRCFDGRCVPTDCSDVVCGEDQRCYFGACHPECDDQDDCLDVEGVDIAEEIEPTCEDGVCVPPPCVKSNALPDGSPCPDAHFETMEVEDVEARAATLTGAVYEMPEPAPTDHGFCWSSQTEEPTHETDETSCESVGELEETGPFSHRVEELEPGTSYHVQAWMAGESQTESEDGEDEDDDEDVQYRYANDDEPVEFTTLAPTVEFVEADQGVDPSEIEVSWEPVDGAVGYRVMRDGEEAADLGGDDTSWIDDQPEPVDDPDAPEGVDATKGEYGDRVEVTWEAVEVGESDRQDYAVVAVYPDTESTPSETVEGWVEAPEVVGYRIYRDDDQLVDVDDPDQSSYEDEDVVEADDPDPPKLEVSQGDYTDHIRLSWEEAEVPDGPAHDYEVATLYEIEGEGAESERSETVEGYGSGDLLDGYVVEIVGETTFDVDGSETEYEYDYDDIVEPEAPSIEGPVDFEATDGTSTQVVELTGEGAEAVEGGEMDFRIRAKYGGDETDWSDVHTGWIGIGQLGYQWEYSEELTDPEDDDFAGLASTDVDEYADGSAPADGTPRAYRAVVDAEGADPVTTDHDTGFRAAPPVVETSRIEDLGETYVEVFGDVETLGAPNPEQHGFCIGRTANPSVGVAECVELGEATETGEFSAGEEYDELGDLTPGTEYYVRAYATNSTTGTTYGENMQFVTEFSEPTNVSATDGEFTDRVEISWDGVAGAQEYEVYRDDTEVAVVQEGDSTVVNDEEADEPEEPDAPQVSATDGELTDRVEVSWNEPKTPEGERHFYNVVAVGHDTTTESGDTGYRRAYDIDDYEMRIDGEGGTDWFELDDSDYSEDDGTFVYEDDEIAEGPTLDVSDATVTASSGDFREYVRLEVEDVELSTADPIPYEVRAVSEAGDGESGADEGYIGVGDLEYQWARSEEAPSWQEGDLEKLDPGNTNPYRDRTVPVDETRYYAVSVDADGVSEQLVDDEFPDGYRPRTFLYVNAEYGDAEGDVCKYDTTWETGGCVSELLGSASAITTAPEGPVSYSLTQGGLTSSYSVCRASPEMDSNSCDDEIHDDTVRDTAVDDDGYVYSASSDETVCRLDGEGDVEWCSDHHSDSVDALAVHAGGSAFSGSADNSICKLPFESDPGTAAYEWCETPTVDDSVLSLAVDADANVYAAVGPEVCRLDSDGNEQWCTEGGDHRVRDVEVGDEGWVYFGRNGGDICRIGTDGSDQSCVEVGLDADIDVRAVTVIPDGTVYTGATDNQLCTVTGDLQIESCVEFDTSVTSIATYPGNYGAFPDAWDDWE